MCKALSSYGVAKNVMSGLCTALWLRYPTELRIAKPFQCKACPLQTEGIAKLFFVQIFDLQSLRGTQISCAKLCFAIPSVCKARKSLIPFGLQRTSFALEICTNPKALCNTEDWGQGTVPFGTGKATGRKASPPLK